MDKQTFTAAMLRHEAAKRERRKRTERDLRAALLDRAARKGKTFFHYVKR